MAERLDGTQLAGILGWLEDEQRQLRGRLGRIEQELEQLTASLREQVVRQRADSAEIEALRQHWNRVPALEEGIRQAQEEVGAIRALATQQTARQERAERAYLFQLERLRQEVVDLTQRLTVVADDLQPLPVRIQALGDQSRRQQDQIAEVQQVLEEVANWQAALQGKIDLAVEQNYRVEQGLAALSHDLEPLRHEGEQFTHRVQLAIEFARRVDQKMSEILGEEQSWRELAERVEFVQAERQRFQQQVGELEHATSGLAERAEELGRILQQEIDRREELGDRLNEIEDRLLDLRQAATEAIIQIWQTAENHKRRELATLQDQARELRETVRQITQASDEC